MPTLSFAKPINIMTNRKFYKHTITIEIVSENDAVPHDLADIAYAISDGGDSGTWDVTSTKKLNGKQAAEELMAQGSDPEFFGLDREGNDV